mmetsp:Transcript_1941/g.3626  ORF Transcript_1941/g.3626 Transcript_1941/m.3626 type:complete len:120 (-) Transcript_1941:9-368(-)
MTKLVKEYNWARIAGIGIQDLEESKQLKHPPSPGFDGTALTLEVWRTCPRGGGVHLAVHRPFLGILLYGAVTALHRAHGACTVWPMLCKSHYFAAAVGKFVRICNGVLICEHVYPPPLV